MHAAGRRSAYLDREKTRHGKMISTMAQLKNCCLGGLRVRQRGRETTILRVRVRVRVVRVRVRVRV